MPNFSDPLVIYESLEWECMHCDLRGVLTRPLVTKFEACLGEASVAHGRHVVGYDFTCVYSFRVDRDNPKIWKVVLGHVQ